MNKDLVIIGGGSAGLTAAISAKKNGVKDILVIEQDKEAGGILNQCIHNGFGLHWFNEELTGPAFAEKCRDLAKENDIEIWLDTTVTKVNKDKTLECINSKGFHNIQAKAIIFTVGCLERSQGAISIPGNRPSGVYTAGTAQKFLNQQGYLVGKKCFILGSGDIGLIMARRMTLEGAKVLGVAELMPYSNGLKRNIVQCLNDFDIPLYLSHTVSNIIGKDKLEAIEVSEVDDKLQIIPGTAKRYEVDTLLLSIGLIPENSLIYNLGGKLDPRTKGPVVDEHLQFEDGMFAAGNGLHVHDLVDYVAAEAERAGKFAADYINGVTYKSDVVDIKPLDNIGYTVPQLLHKESKEFKLSFRVRKPMPKAKIQFLSNGILIKEQIKLNLFPAEMIILDVKEDVISKITTDLEIKVEEVND